MGIKCTAELRDSHFLRYNIPTNSWFYSPSSVNSTTFYDLIFLLNAVIEFMYSKLTIAAFIWPSIKYIAI